MVRAGGGAEVVARNCWVIAHDEAKVMARGVARVHALDRSTVEADDQTVINAYGNSTVYARGRSVVRTEPGASVIVSEQAVRLDYDKKPLALPRATMAHPAQLTG